MEEKTTKVRQGVKYAAKEKPNSNEEEEKKEKVQQLQRQQQLNQTANNSFYG